jgi:pilus assembly protein Flp/PilA
VDVDLYDDAGSHNVRSTTERGATAVEYALLIAVIAAVIVGAVAVLGGQVVGLYQAVTTGW